MQGRLRWSSLEMSCDDTLQEEGIAVVPHLHHGRNLLLVRTSNEFKDWGVVDISGDHPRCRTCVRSTTQCKHIRVATESCWGELPILNTSKHYPKDGYLASLLCFSLLSYELNCLQKHDS
jgi:hypothetical protein